MNLGNIIIGAGGIMRATREYERERATDEYNLRAMRQGIQRMDDEEALRPGRRENEMLKQQILRTENEYKLRSQPAELEHRAAMRPGERTLERTDQQGQLMDAREKQLARIWMLYRSGDEQGALELLNASQMIAPGRKFSRIERGTAPALGPDGKPAMGPDGQPQQQELVRFADGDGKGDMLVPSQALDQVAQRHLGSTKVVGGSVVRMDPFGGVKPVYEQPRYGTAGPGVATTKNGEIVSINTAGLEARAAADKQKLDYQHQLRKELETFKKAHGAESTTALMRNMEYLVKSGVAKDHKEAFERLRTTTEKSERDAASTLAGRLMQSPRYRGSNGPQRAMQDALEMVRSVRGAEADDGGADAGVDQPSAPASARTRAAIGRTYNLRGKSFSDADINATAQKYGITPDEVKQRLGIR